MTHMHPSDFDRDGNVSPFARDTYRRACDDIDAAIATQRIREEVERRRERDDDEERT